MKQKWDVGPNWPTVPVQSANTLSLSNMYTAHSRWHMETSLRFAYSTRSNQYSHNTEHWVAIFCQSGANVCACWWSAGRQQYGCFFYILLGSDSGDMWWHKVEEFDHLAFVIAWRSALCVIALIKLIIGHTGNLSGGNVYCGSITKHWINMT